MRILVVDDDLVVTGTLCRLLQQLGHETAGVMDAASALEHCRQAHYDLVIVDLVMLPMTGLELLRRLRTLAPNSRLVALTGKVPELGDRLAAEDIPVVQKPILTTADARALIEAR